MGDVALMSPADLEHVEGFGFVAADPLVGAADDLGAAGHPEAGETLIEAGAALLSLSPRTPSETKRRSLRAMNLGTFARLWRGRAPKLPPETAEALDLACRALGTHLAHVIGARRPTPLDLPRLKEVRAGVFRRRLDGFAPQHARHLGGALTFVEHGTPLSVWVESGPSLGVPREVREHFDALVEEVRAAEAASVAPREAREEAVARGVKGPSQDAAEELLRGQASAPFPLEVVRDRATARYDDKAEAFTVHSAHYLACLESSSCTTATVGCGEPLAPTLSCMQRDRPCSLKRLAAELYRECLAGVEPDVYVEALAALRAWAASPPAERLFLRLSELDRTLGPEPDEGRVVWLLTPFERLELVRLTPKKKGGFKTRRLTPSEADSELASPRWVIAASILKGLRMYQDRRLGYDGLEALGPALAALAGDNAGDLYLTFEGEARALAVKLATPRLEARLDEHERAQFSVTLGGVELERAAGLKTWVGQLDVHAGTLVLGHITEAMRKAAVALVGVPPTPIPTAERERFAESLLALDKRVPVTPDKSWLGDEVRAEPSWVVQLVWSGKTMKAADGAGGRALEARLRVRIVPELGALVPGDGEKVLPLKRVGPDGVAHLKHVERHFDRERGAAIQVAEALGLDWPGSAADFEWRFLALEEALAFLSEAQSMAAEGRVTLVWDQKPTTIARATKTERVQIRVGFRRDWLDLRGGFLLDGGELPLTELLQALRENKRFVALDEERFVELGAELRRSLAPLASLASGPKVSPLAAPLLDDLDRAGVTIEASDEWLRQADRMREAAALEPPLPPGVKAELRPYQVDGFRWIARLAHWAKGACLADDMGLGKTLQALVFLAHRAPLGPALVIAPTSVVANWVREAARFIPDLDVRRALVGAALDTALKDLRPGSIVVTTWDLLVRHERLAHAVPAPDVTAHDDANGPPARPWATVVFDEAHAMKNAGTKRAQAARALDADFALALTGTPVENRPLELWSLFAVVAPGLLGSLESFRESFGRDFEPLLRRGELGDPRARSGSGTDDDQRTLAARRLSLLIRPFLLRRTKAEVAPELPAKSEVRVDVVLSGDERERYQRVRMAAIAELDEVSPDDLQGGKGLMRVLAVLTRLRQLACHPRLVDPKAPAQSSKLDRLVELAEELRGEGRKMLVFSQFTELLALVGKAFTTAGLTFVQLDGSTPGEERVRAIDRFQSGEVDAFLLSLKAGGVGLNLTTASEVIHLDPWWNPAAEDQASDRAHRIGQDKPVTVYRMVAVGTIEEQILGLHADKREMVSSLLAGTGSARPLSSEDLATLLTGEPPADGDPQRD